MNPRSLRHRSLIAVLAVVLPALVVYAWLSHAHVSHQLGYRLDGRMKHELVMLKEAVLRSDGDNARLREIVELMPIDSFPQRRLYGIWADGERVLATDPLPQELAPEGRTGYADVQAGGQEWRVLTEVIPASAATQQRRIEVLVADPMSARAALIRGGAIDTTLPVLIAVPVLILGIYIALGRSLNPLTQLAAQIRSRSPERLEPLDAGDVPSEALPIAESVNALLSRLGDSLDRERRFTADAAHELRTPLTALKAQAQVALRAGDDNLRREALQSISRTVDRTDRLIAQLLALARLDPLQRGLPTEEVDLAKVTRQTLADLSGIAEARRKLLRLQNDDDVVIQGSSTAVAILVRNIVENAVQYSNEAEPVDIRVFRDGTDRVLEVCDTGPGIPGQVRGEVFERFRRLPDAKSPGTGLGLSIAQRIVELHDAAISLDDAGDAAGLRVTVRFAGQRFA